MIYGKQGTLILLLSVTATASSAQIPHEDLQWINAERERLHPTAEETERGPLTRTMVGGLWVYRAVFSSQDAGRCRFIPSCSHFAEVAIETFGPVRGALMASDRLLRCHPGVNRDYPLDPNTRRNLDPVSRYEAPTAKSSKNPTTAMLLSALIPGSGKVYAGRTLDGVFAALGTLITATFATLNFQRDGISSVRGWFQGSLAVGLYIGNIYGSGVAARQAGVQRAPLVESTERTRRRVDIGLDPPTESAATLYRRGLSSFAAESYETAAAQFLDVNERFPPNSSSLNARFFQSLSHAHTLSWNATRSSLALYREEIAQSPEIDRALTYLDDRIPPERISPALAQTMSAIVPGTGQFYARRFDKGLLAMLANGLLITYVISTLQTESYFELAISAGPLFWRYYRGNITSAGRYAHEFNRRRELEQVDGLYRSLGVD